MAEVLSGKESKGSVVSHLAPVMGQEECQCVGGPWASNRDVMGKQICLRLENQEPLEAIGGDCNRLP